MGAQKGTETKASPLSGRLCLLLRIWTRPAGGAYGCGDSPEEAIMDWADDLDQRIQGLTGDDNAAHLALEHLEK